MRDVRFRPSGWEDFLYWQSSDKKLFRRLIRLIEEIRREPFEGIGKPEPLKGDLSGYWSRRIDDEHRIVYRADAKELVIIKARYDY
ncbi:Txe/YoeB family addiction module toxin [Streptomyces fragilis]|uniref:Endoribonuclease YoeB n=1 Tax=Streptomyces fragilis TaxID=67301 RepID=A0ABV2YJ47_9ACTN|nr:Txe/YoeB family addiction module toxin [Streptomyces fragilis]